MAVYFEVGAADQRKWFEMPGTRRNGRLVARIAEGTKWTAEMAAFLNGINADPEPDSADGDTR